MADTPLLTPEQVAERLQVARWTVVDWLKRGRLPGVKLGKFWRVRPEALEAFLGEHRTATDAGGVPHTSSLEEMSTPANDEISSPPTPPPPPDDAGLPSRLVQRYRIVDCIRAHGGPMSHVAVAAQLGIETSLKDTMQKMSKDHWLQRIAPGVYDVPDRGSAAGAS